MSTELREAILDSVVTNLDEQAGSDLILALAIHRDANGRFEFHESSSGPSCGVMKLAEHVINNPQCINLTNKEFTDAVSKHFHSAIVIASRQEQVKDDKTEDMHVTMSIGGSGYGNILTLLGLCNEFIQRTQLDNARHWARQQNGGDTGTQP